MIGMIQLPMKAKLIVNKIIFLDGSVYNAHPIVIRLPIFIIVSTNLYFLVLSKIPPKTKDEIIPKTRKKTANNELYLAS